MLAITGSAASAVKQLSAQRGQGAHQNRIRALSSVGYRKHVPSQTPMIDMWREKEKGKAVYSSFEAAAAVNP